MRGMDTKLWNTVQSVISLPSSDTCIVLLNLSTEVILYFSVAKQLNFMW